MGKNKKLNSFFINEYIYQIQNRLYKFEKQDNLRIINNIQIICFQSWSLQEYYFFLKNKNKKIQHLDFKYFKLLKINNLNKSQTRRFFYLESIENIILKSTVKELLLKNYIKKKYSINKLLSLSYKSHFFLIHLTLRKSLLFTILLILSEAKISHSLLNNYSKKLYQKCINLKALHKNYFTFSSLKSSYLEDSNLHKSNYLLFKLNFQFLDCKESYQFPRSIVQSTLKENLNLLKNNNFSLKLFQFSYNNFLFLSLSELINSTFALSYDPLRTNFKTFFNNLEQLINIIQFSQFSTNSYSYKRKNTGYIIYKSMYKFSKFLNVVKNSKFLKLFQTYHFSFNKFYKNRLKKSFFVSLDKKLLILKIKNLFFYFILLQPISENLVSDQCYSGRPYLSRYNAIKFLVKNISYRPKYLMHFIIIQSFSKNFKINSKEQLLKSVTFNTLQLKTLIIKLKVNSSLFYYLIKKINNEILEDSIKNSFFSDQNLLLINHFDNSVHTFRQGKESKKISINSQKVYTQFNKNAIEKKIYVLFFNILVNGIDLKIKNFILIKNKELIFPFLKSFKKSKNIFSLFNLQLTSQSKCKNFRLNSLPEVLIYENQLIFLNENVEILYQCFDVLKSFLRLQGFILEDSKINVTNTLISYKKNNAGLDFLGFFIYQRKEKENIINNQYLLIKSTAWDPLDLNFSLKNSYPLQISSKTHNHNKRTFLKTQVSPSKYELKIYFLKLKKIIKNATSTNQKNLILLLTPKIRLWSYYYQTILNKKILQYCDYIIFKMLWRWCYRQHPNKNKKWIKNKYFHKLNGQSWVFAVYNFENSYFLCLPSHTDIK
jgi:hypothetical protein